MFTQSRRFHMSKIVPAIAAGVLVALAAKGSRAATQNIQNTYNRLCPQLIGGDDEFNGNGPETDAAVTLRRGLANQMWLDVYLHQIETRSDWTEGELKRSILLGTTSNNAPYKQIWAPNSAGAYVWTPLGQNPTYGTADIFYVDTDTTLDRFYNPQWWLSEVAINGDTDGGDVGGCSSTDSYMNVRTSAIWLFY
jgi:hypothetical protein